MYVPPPEILKVTTPNSNNGNGQIMNPNEAQHTFDSSTFPILSATNNWVSIY